MIFNITFQIIFHSFFFPKIDENDLNEIFFQQDIATCHTATETMNLLRGKFNDSFITRFGPVNWPARS